MNFKKLKLNKNSRIKLKCFFTLILVFTMVISSIPNINVFANESYEYKCIGEDAFGYCLKQTLKDVQPNTQHPTNNVMPMLFKVKHRDDNDISKAYCLDVNTPINDNTNYSISNIEDSSYYTDENAARKIRAIVKNSYPYVGLDKLVSNLKEKTNDPNFNLKLEEYTGDKEANEYKNAYDIARVAVAATQLAIWYYSNDEFDTEIRQNLKDMDGNWIKDPEIKGFIRSDVEKIYDILLSLDAEDAEEPVAKILSKEPIIVSENGDTVDIEFRFKIDGNNVDDKMNYTIENKPVDSKIIEYYELDEDGYKRIRVTNIPSGENIKFIISGIQYINKDVFLYKPEGGREASQTLIGARSGKINISKTFDYKCTFGEVEVTKVDSKNENIRLEGAEFTIKNSKNEVVKVITTRENGIASTKLLPGKYTIEETQAPEGYEKLDGKEEFIVSENQTEKIIFTFTNKKLIFPTKLRLEATKKLEGKNLEAGMFSFELLDEDNNVLQTVKNSENGKVQFAEITYDKEGTYKYKVREVKGNLGGVSYDENKFEVTVNVVRNNKGQLVATPMYPEGGIVFNNSYKADSTSIAIKATKILEGKGLEAGIFNFDLLDEKGEVIETVDNSVDGKIQFKAITYDQVGTYKYKVREVKGNLGGITYDKTVFEVTVEVTDNGKGKLEAKVVYPEGGVTFKNIYKAASTDVELKANKKLTGKKIVADMFSFKLLDKDGNAIETVKNDEKGKAKFNKLIFDKVGTYTYQIVEVDEELSGVTYDSQPVDVTIEVTDNGEGQLEATVSYPTKQPEFNNSYKAGSTSAAIEATKTLEGKDLEAGMFSFELLDKNNNVLQTVKNNADGKVQFAAITYDKEGTHEYKIREVKGSLGGITYDEKVYNVTVNITDDQNGNLVATVKYPEGGISFKNTVIKGILEFTKTDVSTGEVIEGAHIKITCTEGLDKGKLIEFTSSKEGNKFELKAGKYTFEETQAPEGYELTTEVGIFEIKENGEVVKAELKNYPIKGSAKLIKVDKDDNSEKIEGVKFVLLAEDKETIIAKNLVTDTEGKIIVSNLEPGIYYFKEVEAASGYILDDTLIEVKVEFNQQEIATVIFENTKEKKVEVINPNTNTKPNTNSPQTSDTLITGYAITGLVAAGALVGINRRRKNK